MPQKARIIAIVGPTATGKTALGVMLAKHLGGEVVSADSRQVYRGLDIGTGKVTKAEAGGVPHHLIDIADPRVQYTVADFVRDGQQAIADISARGRTPIIVGGTGFYIDALLGRTRIHTAKPDEVLRKRLNALSLEQLQSELQNIDPERLMTIDIKNPRRLMRAIEIARSATHDTGTIYDTSGDVRWIGLTLPMDELRARISARLHQRLAAGMLDEARRLHAEGLSYERMHELGLEYRAMAKYLLGALTHDQMVAELESEIYKYAKRQMTWFKRNADIQWIEASRPDAALELALSA